MSEKVKDILKEVKVPVFNLYNEHVPVIEIDSRLEILEGEFKDYNPKYKLEILLKDISCFLDKLRGVENGDGLNSMSLNEYINDYMKDEVFNMMKLSATHAKAIRYPDGLIEWARIVELILKATIQDSHKLHYSFACNWLNNLTECYNNLDPFSWALIAYYHYDKELKFGKKLTFLCSFAEKWTKVKPDTFRKKYKEVESLEWRNSEEGQDYQKAIQPIIEVWHI